MGGLWVCMCDRRKEKESEHHKFSPKKGRVYIQFTYFPRATPLGVFACLPSKRSSAHRPLIGPLSFCKASLRTRDWRHTFSWGGHSRWNKQREQVFFPFKTTNSGYTRDTQHVQLDPTPPSKHDHTPNVAVAWEQLPGSKAARYFVQTLC